MNVYFETLLGQGSVSRATRATIHEKGVKIFFKSTCQYCKSTNEKMRTEISKIKGKLKIEECNLWACYREALRRGITFVATCINEQPVLPMKSERFLKTIRHLARENL